MRQGVASLAVAGGENGWKKVPIWRKVSDVSNALSENSGR